jgi:hypothetical protein
MIKTVLQKRGQSAGSSSLRSDEANSTRTLGEEKGLTGTAGSPVSIKEVDWSTTILTPEELGYQDPVRSLIANELPKKLSTGPKREEGVGELLGKATRETKEGNTLPEREVYFMLYLAITSTYLVYFQGPDKMILLATVYMANPPAVGSSPLQQNAVGGIDFRNIPMIVQPIGNFSNLKFNPPASSPALQKMNLDEEFRRISLMVERGILPSAQRVKEFIFACCYKKELGQRLADLIPLLTSLCRLQEECVCESEPELKESLMLVEAAQ